VIGTVEALNQWPPACGQMSGGDHVPVIFRVEQVEGFSDSDFHVGQLVELDDRGFSVGQRLIVLGTGGWRRPSTAARRARAGLFSGSTCCSR
jgi:hypothetical protein